MKIELVTDKKDRVMNIMKAWMETSRLKREQELLEKLQKEEKK